MLDLTIQDGKKLPCWKPKSCQDKFLGQSKRHASDIGLVQNLQTDYVSTQFHVVYNYFFTTVKSNKTTVPNTWLIFFDTRRKLAVGDGEQAPPVNNSWLDGDKIRRRLDHRRSQNRLRPRLFDGRVIPEQNEPPVATKRAVET